jgi:hypothetical protein
MTETDAALKIPAGFPLGNVPIRLNFAGEYANLNLIFGGWKK